MITVFESLDFVRQSSNVFQTIQINQSIADIRRFSKRNGYMIISSNFQFLWHLSPLAALDPVSWAIKSKDFSSSIQVIICSTQGKGALNCSDQSNTGQCSG